MPKISVYRGRTHLFDHWSEKDEVVIGRSADAEIPLDSPAASRRHCRIVRRQHSYVLEELGAKNGLFVNGKYCNVHTMKDGDRIEIADLILAFSHSRSEMRHDQAVRGAQRGAAFRITTAEVERAMHKGNADAKGQRVRASAASASAKQTTAVSPDELAKLMSEMQKKLQAHVEVQVNGQHLRTALVRDSYLVGFVEGCDIHLGARPWPWGKLAAKVLKMTDGNHKLERLSKWVGIKVGGEKMGAAHILRDKDVIEIGGVKLRYLGRSEMAK